MRQDSNPTRRWFAPTAAGLLALVAACASPGPPPVGQLASARAAIAQAETAGAVTAAPVDLLAARDKLGRAEVAVREQHFPLARQLAEQSEVDAQLAERKARAVKAQADATEIERGNDTLRQELERKSHG